jgi:hypothetical protein
MWSEIAKDRFGLWFRRNQPLHPESIAYCVARGEKVVGPQELNTDVWFPDRPSGVEFEISEEAPFFPSFGFSLSIITFH